MILFYGSLQAKPLLGTKFGSRRSTTFASGEETVEFVGPRVIAGVVTAP